MRSPAQNRGLTRRQLLRGAALTAGAAASHGLRVPAFASPRRGGETVAIFGGGVGGLTVAHELAERGFAVTVFEKRAWGGKVRSYGVPGSASGGRAELPAEHCTHIIHGCYQNLPDTLRRIPFGSNPRGVFDNLVGVPEGLLTRTGDRREFSMALRTGDPKPYEPSPSILTTALTQLPPDEAAFLLDRMFVFLSSSDARRFGQWENVSWWDFCDAERFSKEYQELVVDLFTRLLVAQSLRGTSARVTGTLIEQIFYNSLGRCGTGSVDQIFDLPKNAAFIDPWIAYLASLGVGLRLGHSLTGFDVQDGRVAAAGVSGPNGAFSVTADHYVCALPVERARSFWTPEILDADPRLADTFELGLIWCSAIQYYLRRPTPLARGHVGYLDSPWALGSVSETQFWPERDFARDYGDGTALECFSVSISDFDTPGVVYELPARELSPEQIAHDAWVQMKQHLNKDGEHRLEDEDLISWYLDPGLIVGASGTIADFEDPLVTNTVGSWSKRPTAATAIPNLFLAADYVQAGFPVTTTEVANEAGRRAANAILATSSSNESPCRIYDLYRPPEWEAFKAIDEIVYAQGLPHLADPPSTGIPIVEQMRETFASTLGMSGLDGLGAFVVPR